MKKIVSLKKQISDTAVQLYNDGFWESLGEQDFISIKTADGTEVYVRVFGKDSDYTGMGIYTKPVDYALSELIEDCDIDYISPMAFFQKGFIGLMMEKKKKNSIEFRNFINGYIYDIIEIKDAEFLLDVMQCLEKCFELYVKETYKDGFKVNVASQSKFLLLHPK